MAVKQTFGIKCDGPDCPNQIEYPVEMAQIVMKQTPWMRTLRFITTPDKREFQCCSDVCNIKLIQTGVLNPPAEPKQPPQQPAISLASEADVAAAAAQADIIKSGSGGKIVV
jgi:hypothetical protein